MNFQCVGVAKEGKIKRAPGLICVLIDVQPSDVGDVSLVMLVKNFMDIANIILACTGNKDWVLALRNVFIEER